MLLVGVLVLAVLAMGDSDSDEEMARAIRAAQARVKANMSSAMSEEPAADAQMREDATMFEELPAVARWLEEPCGVRRDAHAKRTSSLRCACAAATLGLKRCAPTKLVNGNHLGHLMPMAQQQVWNWKVSQDNFRKAADKRTWVK